MIQKIIIFSFCMVGFITLGQEDDLANKIQNPVANLISLPFQNNTDFGDDATNTLNIQPVLPFKLSKNWNLVTRTIIPIINAPYGMHDRKNGIGNITTSAFITPMNPKGIIWAVGPTFMFPSVENNFGYEKLGLAPSVALIYQAKGLTIGGIAQNFFGIAGSSNVANLNLLYSQIFVTKNLPNDWYINSAPIFTANWEADSDSTWTIPMGAGGGKLFKFGKLPINSQIGFYKYLEHPNDADWELRFQITLLFPK